MKKKIFFVSGNKHKFTEIKNLTENSLTEFEVIQSNEPLLEIQADSLEEVAEFKVKSVINKIFGEYFIEDAGFFVDDHLHGFPGVYSSYVMKTIGYDGVLQILGKKTPRNAHFESIIAFCDIDRKIHLFKGENRGSVSLQAQGTSGFGFDPIFLSCDYPDRTYAELTLDEKNKVSHRSRSMQKFIEFLKKRGN
jgi:XTP/dITP diphosphohydrolase